MTNGLLLWELLVFPDSVRIRNCGQISHGQNVQLDLFADLEFVPNRDRCDLLLGWYVEIGIPSTKLNTQFPHAQRGLRFGNLRLSLKKTGH